MCMSEPPNEFYSEDRWQNWVDRIKASDIDIEDEDSGRLLINMRDDTALAVAKVISAYDDGQLDEDEAVEEFTDIREVVLADVEFEDEPDEDALMIIDDVQTSLTCVFEAARGYVVSGPADDASIEEYLNAAADAEVEEAYDQAFGYCAQAGTLVIDGEELDIGLAEDMEYGLVTAWINGLDSLQTALSDPEVIEEEDEEE